MINLLYSLPLFIQTIVYEFDYDKGENWERVKSQFMKGGFHNKHLKLEYFLTNETSIVKRWWSLRHLTKRPILREWECETASASFGRYHRNGNVLWKMPISEKPVTNWLRNIAKFERTYKYV